MAIYTDVRKLSLDWLRQGVAETVWTADNLTALMPMVNIAPAVAYQWNKEATIATGNSGSVIAIDGTFTPQSASYTNTTQQMTLVGASFNLPKPLQNPTTIATELTKKGKAVGRSIGNMLFNATIAGATYFDGFAAVVSGSSTDIPIAAVGSGSFSFSKFEQALYSVGPMKPTHIVTSTEGMRYFKNALRSTGTTAEYLQLPNYGTSFLQYEGIPVIQSDFVANDIYGGASYYFLYCNEVDGITLFSNYSMLVDVIGPVPVANSVNDNYVVNAAFGLVVPSGLNIARLSGVTS